MVFAALVSLSSGTLSYASDQQLVAVEARPVWLWGVSRSAGGEYTEAGLALANQWAEEQFGATFRVSAVQEGVSSNLEGLNILIADGEFPDFMSLGEYDLVTRKMLTDLARFDKIMPVDRYFNDPEHYPQLSRVGRNAGFMRAYLYRGQIYGIPGWGTRLDADEPAWEYGARWNIRMDLVEEYGMPDNPEELLGFLKRVKRGGHRDLEGTRLIPFGLHSRASNWNGIIFQLKGAGWEVDPQKRLMPRWASQEAYESLKYLNTLWQEGLMHPRFAELDWDTIFGYCFSGTFAVFAGPSWWINGPTETLRRTIAAKGFNSAQAKHVRERIHIMMVPPARGHDGTLGRVVNKLASVNVMSKNNPNPDATMKLIEWLLTEEGIITAHYDAGLRGVDWEFTERPLYWELLYSRGRNYPRTDEMRASGSAIKVQDAEANPPRILPFVHDFARPAHAATDSRIRWDSYRLVYTEGMGVPVGDGGFTVKEQEYDFCLKVQKSVISPNPSYEMADYDLDPLAWAAFAVADQIWTESLPAIIGADTLAAFDAEYEALLDGLMRITNWKPVFEKKQKAWLRFLAFNKIDDRAQLRTVTPRPEWKHIMGW